MVFPISRMTPAQGEVIQPNRRIFTGKGRKCCVLEYRAGQSLKSSVRSSSARKAQNRIAQREFRLRKQVSNQCALSALCLTDGIDSNMCVYLRCRK